MGSTVDGVYRPSLHETGWDDEVNDNFSRLAELGVNVKGTGVTANGSTDDTVELQEVLDTYHSSGTASSVARDATQPIYLPAGGYKVSAPITSDSLRGLKIRGAGPWLTKFYPAATMDSLFDLNGQLYPDIGGFSVHGDLQAGTKVDKVINLYWDSADAARATNMATFRDIHIVDATWTTAGFKTTKTSNSPEVDNVKFYNCFVNGGWAGAGSDSQSGFHFGSGTAANALAHHCYGCQVTKTRYGLQSQGVSFTWHGGQMAMGNGSAMDRAFYISSSPKWALIQGMRTESAKRLIEVLGFSTMTDITLDSIEYSADLMDADTFFINWLAAGSLQIRNVLSYNADGAVLRLAPATGGWMLHAKIDGMSIRGTAPLSQISIGGSGTTNLEAVGLQQMNSSNQPTVQLDGRLLGGSVGVVRDLSGTATPEGAVTANVGSTYRRVNGGAGTSFYVKESGTGNTGWVAK